ncbi:response regulator transcription factor [Pedobacter sp. MC2016-14]|uniref:response regulator transcription factor n=1 Tax=Pedobacter sp. MC2016-14 TaxID=2897327 RepID=UPI001E42159E|nr:response regulator transcription factor [Pedobacter sp. MC2016-14]MCD0487823.1 response regulator transcription factor [Pedobacter sp. MC2016-14]
MKILIIEDEPELADGMVSYLSGQNYLCELAIDYEQALEKIHSHQYDCILLDLMLPGGSGMDILDELKLQKKEDGVIIISAKNSLEDRINGLKLGADDYIAKPFHLSELSARIFSVIRRRNFANANTIQQGELTVDLLAKTVAVRNTPVVLTKKEFEMLIFFIGNKNKVISKSALAEHLSGDLADMLDNHDFIYAHVKNLKKKLAEAGCENYLKTLYGNGYKWEV